MLAFTSSKGFIYQCLKNHLMSPWFLSRVKAYFYSPGKTLGENLEELPGLSKGQEVVMPIDRPIKETGHLQILYGNLAPDGCVGKITGKEGLLYEGTARCFDSEEDMLSTLEEDPNSFKVKITFKDHLQYLGSHKSTVN